MTLEHRNEVVVVGRLAAPVEERALASGDVLAQFRLVVPRPEAARRVARAPLVDTLDCVAWPAGLRRRVAGWQPGDVVEVQGALRRRFWRTPGGPASRCEIEVERARRVSRQPAPA